MLVDFSKSEFDQDFRETCIATLSNFSDAENVRLLVHNSLSKIDFYKELIRIFGYAGSGKVQIAAGNLVVNFLAGPATVDFPRIFINEGVIESAL
jgi:hypothetical protein